MKTYVEGFRNILRRLKAESNRNKYNDICNKCNNADEERVWQLCQKFWPQAYSDRNVSIDEYVANDNLDEQTAQRYLKELSDLLDKLGWDQVSDEYNA